MDIWGRMRKVLVAGSIFAIGILILASFPSVVGAQAMRVDEERINKLIDMCINRIQRDNRYEDAEVNEMVSSLQHIKDVIRDGGWFPGFYLIMLIYGLIGMFLLFLSAFP